MDLRNTDPADTGSRPLPPATPKQPAKFLLAEATESSKGNPMIKWQVQLMAEEAEGYTCYGNFLTTDVKGAGFSKAHLVALAPALGLDLDRDTLDDNELADRLIGLECFVDIKYEVIKDQDPRTQKYTVARMETNAAGKEVPAKRAVIKNFYSHATGGQATPSLPVAPAPQQGGYPVAPPQQPPQYAQPPAQHTQAQPQYQQPAPPQQGYQHAPQGTATPAQNQPQYAQPPAAPQQYAQPVQNAAPAPQQPAGGAVPPWMQQAPTQPQQAAPVATETQATGGRRGRKPAQG